MPRCPRDVSIPVIANNPTGCNYGQLSGPITVGEGDLRLDHPELGEVAAGVGILGTEGRPNDNIPWSVRGSAVTRGRDFRQP